MGEPTISPLYWINLVLLILVSIASYFLKRSLNELDSMEKQVQELKTKVSILLDRDRRKRLQDYEEENGK